MNSTEQIQRLLIHNKRPDLAKLLINASFDFNESNNYGSYLISKLTTVEIFAPLKDYESLLKLNNDEANEILKAFIVIYPPKEYEIEINHIGFYLDSSNLSAELLTDEELINEINTIKNIMTDVSTGGQRIQNINDDYKISKKKINKALKERNISDPNPFNDLWEWYNKWHSGNYPSYQSRRIYINDLFDPLIDIIKNGYVSQRVNLYDSLTGWESVDRCLKSIKDKLVKSIHSEEYQQIGLLSREALINLAKEVYDPNIHKSSDDVTPSSTDAKRMLESYLMAELCGKANEISRKHAKASLDFANELQHKRTADFRDAALCAEATISLVNIVSIISGKRKI